MPPVVCAAIHRPGGPPARNHAFPSAGLLVRPVCAPAKNKPIGQPKCLILQDGGNIPSAPTAPTFRREPKADGMIRRTISLYRDAYKGLPVSIWLLAVVTLINRSGTMVIPFLSIYLTSRQGFTLQEAGVTTFLFGFGSMVGSYLGGHLTDRIGYFRVIWSSLVAGGLLFVLLGYTDGKWAIWGTVLVLSVIAESFRPATMTAVGRFSEPGNRTRSFSLIRMAINLGWSIGPAVGGLLIATAGYRSLFWVDGLTCIAAGAFFAAALRERKRPAPAGTEPPAPAVPSPPVGSPYRDKPYLVFLLVTTLASIIFMQMITTLPVYFNQEVHLGEEEIGALMALNGVLIVLLEMPLIFTYEQRLDRMNGMGWGVVLYGLAYVLFNFFPMGFSVAVVSMVALSFGEMLNMPLANTYAMSRTTEANRGRYMGLYSMTFSVAHIVGPSIGFAVAGSWGFPALWYLLGAMSVAVWAGYAWLKRRRPLETR